MFTEILDNEMSLFKQFIPEAIRRIPDTVPYRYEVNILVKNALVALMRKKVSVPFGAKEIVEKFNNISENETSNILRTA